MVFTRDTLWMSQGGNRRQVLMMFIWHMLERKDAQVCVCVCDRQMFKISQGGVSRYLPQDNRSVTTEKHGLE